MSFRRRQLLLLLLFSAVAMIARRSAAAHCSDNLFPEDEDHLRRSSGVRLTKELSANEYGPMESFKTLHCCGKNYLSLEWFKDNRPYPWPSDVSSFILNPESANQTIYTRSLKLSDHGVYTCQLANQTNIVNHSIKLVTIDVASYWGEPLATYRVPEYHYAMPGDSARLYCEGFVGKVDLPDAVNTIRWKKIGGNETIEPNGKYRTEQVVREDSQVLGAFLFINNIRETDYGQYMCSISNADDQILLQYTNITKPVFIIERPDKKVHVDLKLIIFVMLALISVVWKRRLLYLAYHALRKKFENDKYALSEKTVHSVAVFHDEENKESAEHLVEKMERHDSYTTKKHRVDFDEDFVRTHADLAKGYDFAIYLLSSSDSVAPSSLKSARKSFVRDDASPVKYIIDLGNTPATPTKSWCDQVLADLSGEQAKRNHHQKSTTNKLIGVV